MISGIGIDTVEITRFRRFLDEGNLGDHRTALQPGGARPLQRPKGCRLVLCRPFRSQGGFSEGLGQRYA